MIASARERWLRLLLIALATAALCWPAMLNGYPLIAPDALAFLGDGPSVWKALMGHGDPWLTPGRPVVYGIAIYMVNWGRSAWPGVVLQSAAVAWVVWLVVRVLRFRHTAGMYAAVVAVLCVGSSLPWMVSWSMPDVLGPVTYLCAWLLAFAGDRLHRRERWGAAALGCFGMASHPSHLLVAICLCGCFAVFGLIRRNATGGRMVAVLAAMSVAAVALQLAIHERILHKLTLNGPRPVYLMARVITDGPAQVYLKTHCAALQWTICRFQDRMTYDESDFLWQPYGVWMSATWQERDELRKEEMPLVLATLRTYPRAQLRRSAQNFFDQLKTHQLDVAPDTPWMEAWFRRVMPRDIAVYLRSRQGRNAMPVRTSREVAAWMMWIAWLTIAALLWRTRRNPLLLWLLAMVACVMPLNAAVTAVLSGISWRYQSRVEWMVVLVALLMVGCVLEQRAARQIHAA